MRREVHEAAFRYNVHYSFPPFYRFVLLLPRLVISLTAGDEATWMTKEKVDEEETLWCVGPVGVDPFRAVH